MGEDNEVYHESYPESESMIEDRNTYVDELFNSELNSGIYQSVELHGDAQYSGDSI